VIFPCKCSKIKLFGPKLTWKSKFKGQKCEESREFDCFLSLDAFGGTKVSHLEGEKAKEKVGLKLTVDTPAPVHSSNFTTPPVRRHSSTFPLNKSHSEEGFQALSLLSKPHFLVLLCQIHVFLIFLRVEGILTCKHSYAYATSIH